MYKLRVDDGGSLIFYNLGVYGVLTCDRDVYGLYTGAGAGTFEFSYLFPRSSQQQVKCRHVYYRSFDVFGFRIPFVIVAPEPPPLGRLGVWSNLSRTRPNKLKRYDAHIVSPLPNLVSIVRKQLSA